MIKRLITVVLFSALAAIHAAAQAQPNRFPPINLVAGDPTGTACPANSIVQSSDSGVMYTCQGGAYRMPGGTSIPPTMVTWPPSCTSGTYIPATNTCVPTGTAANPGGAPSQVQFNAGGGTFGTDPNITIDSVKHSLNAGPIVSNAQPMLDIRHPSFAGGAVCDDTTDIGPALQAAWNALPSAGGQIQIIGYPTPCYWADPATFNWSAKTGSVTFYLQGQLHTGNTLTIPSSGGINFIGIGGSNGAQFQGPSAIARIRTRPLSNIPVTGTIGTAITPTYTGAGNPTATLPVVCSSANTGVTYRDTNQVQATMWQCAQTLGTITAGSNQLTVTNPAGLTVTDNVKVTGAGAAGGVLTTKITAQSGSVFTLAANAGTSVSGAIVNANVFGDFGLPGSTFGWRWGAVTTFTPSSMAGILPGIGLGIAETMACNIVSISRTANKVSATTAAGCHIPPGVPITVAGVTDSTFNCAFVSGTNCMMIANDYVTNVAAWNQTAANASSTGGTVTGYNEDVPEYVTVTAISATTATAVFARPHISTAQFGQISVHYSAYGGSPDMMQNITLGSDGPGLWLEAAYLSTFDKLGITANAMCSGNLTSIPVAITDSSFNHITNSGLNTGCAPYSIHMTQPYSIGFGGSGPLYLEDSFFMAGIKLDHGASGVYVKNVVAEQAVAGFVRDDPTAYWNGNQNLISLENSGIQDNPGGFATCFVALTTPSYGGGLMIPNVALKHMGSSACMANDYFTLSHGPINVLIPNAHPQWGQAQALGVGGTFNDGKATDGEVRGINADMHPAVLPFATLPVNTNPATWSGTCTVTTGQLAPDGTHTAAALTAASAGGIYVETYSVTPQTGDSIIYGAWAYSPTVGRQFPGGASGASLVLDTGANPHFSFFTGVQATPAAYDSGIVNDWWHPVVGLAQLTTDGTNAAGSIRLNLPCDQNHTMMFWQPFMMYIPATANIPLAELNRWRTQLLHGSVPPNAAAGQTYSGYPIILPADPTSNFQAATKGYVDAHSGVSPIVASLDLLAQSANIGNTTLYAVPAGKAGFYRFTCYMVVTTIATTSSTLPQCNVLFTDNDTGVNARIATGNTSFPLGVTSTQNLVGATNSNNTYPILTANVAQSSNILYAVTGYLSTGATAMQYALHLRVEYVGP